MSMFVVTTCNRELWDQCGRRMAETHRQYWPADVPLYVYAENFDVDVPCIQRALPGWFMRWKQSLAMHPDAHGLDLKHNRRGRPYDFRRDCVRFAHKVAALTDTGLSARGGLMVWADADVLTHAAVDEVWLRGKLRGGYMAWLDRERIYPECGFVLFDCNHPRHRDFMELYRCHYETLEVLSERETHDSYVLQQLVNQCVANGWFTAPASLSGGARRSHHPLPASPLGARLDHAKGPRKVQGRTPRHEVRGRTEEHWK